MIDYENVRKQVDPYVCTGNGYYSAFGIENTFRYEHYFINKYGVQEGQNRYSVFSNKVKSTDRLEELPGEYQSIIEEVENNSANNGT